MLSDRRTLRRPSPPDKIPNPNEELQRHKLELEIAELKRSPWTKPAVVLPILATLATLALSQYLGVFDVERKRIEIAYKESLLAKQEVEGQIRSLSDEKSKLAQEQRLLTDKRNQLSKQITSLSAEVDILKVREAAARKSAEAATDRVRDIENRLSVPHLSIGWNFDHSTQSAEIRVVNRGLGPAQIRDTKYYVDGVEVSRGEVSTSLAKAIDILYLNERWVKTEVRTSAILSNEIVSIIKVLPEDFTETRARQLQAAAEHLGIEICYCSNLGGCKWAVFHRETPRKSCQLKSNKLHR